MLKVLEKINLFSDYSYMFFIVSTILTIASIFTGGFAPLLISAIFLFSSMDAIGYFHLVWGGDQGIPANNQEERLVSYRFIQTVFQIMLSLILYMHSGITYALAFNIIWWFGFCDMLYYIMLKQRFIDYEDMFWLWWTPAGILKKAGLIKTITGRTMLIQSIVGIVVACAFMIFFS